MKTSLKSADWTEEEMHELLDAWDPRLSMLCGASQREKIKIWNNIYFLNKKRCPESQKKNLDNKFRHLKQ